MTTACDTLQTSSENWIKSIKQFINKSTDLQNNGGLAEIINIIRTLVPHFTINPKGSGVKIYIVDVCKF